MELGYVCFNYHNGLNNYFLNVRCRLDLPRPENQGLSSGSIDITEPTTS